MASNLVRPPYDQRGEWPCAFVFGAGMLVPQYRSMCVRVTVPVIRGSGTAAGQSLVFTAPPLLSQGAALAGKAAPECTRDTYHTQSIGGRHDLRCTGVG